MNIDPKVFNLFIFSNFYIALHSGTKVSYRFETAAFSS